MSARHSRRNIDGLLLLDKPTGITSNDALQQVKRIFNAQKAGHTGALDPLATGMLPICLGEATKFSRFLLDADKHYRVIAKLGQRTDTSDAEGNIIAQREVNFTAEELQQALDFFRGESLQTPSMYSALKYQGRPLYEYARQGITIPRQARPIEVSLLTLISYDTSTLELVIQCSKGTYIRSLIDDLGERLGCGAHVTHLHRLQVADHPSNKMVSLETLHQLASQSHTEDERYSALDRYLLPLHTLVKALPAIRIALPISENFKQGQAIRLGELPKEGYIAVFQQEDSSFIGIGESDQHGYLAPRRLVVMS